MQSARAAGSIFTGGNTVDSTTVILLVVFAVLVVAYTVRRRSRLRSEE
jgi:hypothetical protein